MEYTRLSLVLTDKCSALCDFCSLSCGPDCGRVMDADLMLRMIRGAKALGIEAVEFSGGEPLLCPELLTKGVHAAHEEKLKVEIATNGFWGAWDDDQITEMLKALKPATVNISIDFFHRKYIPDEHILRSIAACGSQGIHVILSVADMDGTYSAGRFLQSFDNRRYNIDLHIYPVRRHGRAVNMPEACFLAEDKRENVADLYDNTLCVFFNGDVYPCPNEAPESDRKVGNVRETSWQELIGTLRDDAHGNAGRKEAPGDVS